MKSAERTTVDHTFRCGITTVVAILAAVGISSCSGGESEEEQISETVSLVASTDTALTSQAENSSGSESNESVEAASQFDLSMVRDVVVNKESKGGQSNVTVVVEGVGLSGIEEIGLQCVEHYLRETKAAFCQVWGTQADYDARSSIGKDIIACWVLSIGVPINGGDPIVTGSSEFSYRADGCPGGVW